MARTTANHRRTWGQIRKLPSGNYQASYIGPDRCRHTAEVTYSTRVRAEGWLADERRHIENRDWTPPAVRAAEQHAKTTTLADCAAEWLAHATSNREPVPTTGRCLMRTLPRRWATWRWGT